jgi:kumamolisin
MVSLAESRTLPTHHQRQETLAGRTPLVGHLPENQIMHIQIILQHRNESGLQQFLKEQQDRNSSNYRKTLTVAQFTEQYGPSRSDYEAVKAFARQNGLEILSGSPNRMLLQVRGTVANIEKAFHVSMSVYQHDTEPRTFFAPDREPTPELSVQLWHVGGLDNYATPHPAFHKLSASEKAAVKSNATTGSGPDASFLGSDMRAAYYVDGNSSATLTGTGQAVGLFEFIGTDLVDLTTYYTNVGQTDNVPVTLTSVDTQSTSCTEKGDCDDTEQTIDMTQALGMAPGMSGLTMWIGTGGLAGQTLDDPGILNGMVSADPLQAQLSCSWEWKPTDNTTDDPFFETMAAQGQTFFVAAGDDGNWKSAEFVWPSDDVNIVSVGGTDLDTSSAAGPWASETGWEDGGGGISPNKFAIPSWQVAAAAGCSKCSQVYRNGPDVSANANFSFYVCADQEACTANDYGGTSFATPMWAGYIALTNEQYLANGATSTLGFINTALYDIFAGSNYLTDFHNVSTGGASGVVCTVDYSLGCGLGSPNGDNLLIALSTLTTAPGFTLSASPSSVSVLQGASGTSTITSAVTDGFDSAITLTASGQPSGVTVSFSPTSITGAGTSTATFAVGSAVTAGTYTVTITGTSGSIVETTTVSLTVTAAVTGSFTLSEAKSTLSVAPGTQTPDKVTATPSGGFTGTIALSASGQPTGVTVAFSPTSIAGGSGSAATEIKVAKTAKAGTYTITVKGTSGSTTATTTITLTIT